MKNGSTWKFDEELSYENRCLRTFTGKLLCGPAGNRLKVDVLERKPGFVGCIDFIHKTNITELFTVTASIPMNLEQAQTMWYPTHMTMTYEDEDVALEERKILMTEDVAISVMKWSNRSEEPLKLTFSDCPEQFVADKNIMEEAAGAEDSCLYEQKS